MEDLLAARTQMAVSLMFHILFAIAGMAMPVLMIVSEWLWLRTRQELGVIVVFLLKRHVLSTVPGEEAPL